MLIFTRIIAFIPFLFFILLTFKSYSRNKLYYFLWLFGLLIISTPALLPIYKNRRHEAAINGNIKAIEKYLKQGVDINRGNF